MLDLAICIVSNMFHIYLIYRFVTLFLGKTDVSESRIYFVYITFFVVNTALFWTFRTAWINIICNLVGISTAVRLHTKSFKTNLFVTCAIYLICASCDVLATSTFIHYEDGQAHSQIYAALATFLLWVCELLTEKMVTIHKDTEQVHNLPLIFVPLCSIAVICVLVYSDTCTDRGVALVGAGLLIINFFLLYLYNMLLHSLSQEYESKMLRQKVEIYSHQLDVISQSEEKVKSMRHDMKHHINELKLLANKYDIEEMKQYIEHMDEFIDNPEEIISSGNKEIDSVLNYMLQKARNELKTVHTKVMIPEEMAHSFDINILLGNLLENAIEASSKTDEKYLKADIVLNRGVLKIKIENSFLQNSLIENKKNFLTTKREKEKHGIGLRNVKKIVEEYNGSLEIKTDNHIFAVKIIIYLS